MNLVTGIQAKDPVKYALSLMDNLFTEEEMGQHCFEENKRTTKPGLDKERVKLLEGGTYSVRAQNDKFFFLFVQNALKNVLDWLAMEKKSTISR